MPDTPLPEAARAAVLEVVDRLAARQPDVGVELARSASARFEPVDGVPEATHALLEGATRHSLDDIFDRLRRDCPPEHDGIPAEAVIYVRELAQRGVPTIWLRRAYQVAADEMVSVVFAEVEGLEASGDLKLQVFRHLARWLHTYADCASLLVADLHQTVLVDLAERHSSEVLAQVHLVMKGEEVDPEAFLAVTGHELAHTHLGVVLWLEDIGHGPDRTGLLREVAAEVAEAMACPEAPLTVQSGRSELLAWYTDDGCDPVRHEAAVRDVLDRRADVRLAIGSPGAGGEGFRRSMEQARSLRHLVRVAPSVPHRALFHSEAGVALVAMLAQDLPAARRWVGNTLGSLADDSETARRTRETLRVYLRTNSYVETAEQLQLHRNTVKYRLTKVAAERGRELTEGRLDLELALQACHVLGDIVLRRTPDAGASTR
ncbi:helix-turn-helix domain-containing protein [Nocardioides sp. Y6]|uniref:Helix-turn-helix domain-containing protein n=1 Tax=Nocardioides malaquae TaxID=2773426 RepID=A0ABR9RV51_9ACTN|nr:helix-turn-helix domain-containing protein [Nocardioides malaquae]MBE7325478.1 helix-turn-helix domain-containing protein [Nocardioides malaquae]